MNIVQRAGVVALGLLPLVLGCVESDTDSFDMEDDGPVAEPQTGGESNNGLPSNDFYSSVPLLMSAMTTQLLQPGTTTLTTAAAATGIMGSSAGQKTLKYAIKCALPANQVVAGSYQGQDYKFEGEGLLSTTGPWLMAGGLTQPAQLDVLTCVLAHLNNLPNEESVQIYLSGQHMAPGTGDPASYPVEEALFQATVNGAIGLQLHVYALPSFAAACAGDPELALKKRLCSDPDNNCNVIYHPDLTACTHNVQSDEYTCNSAPTIKTQLKFADLPVLHPTCVRRR